MRYFLWCQLTGRDWEDRCWQGRLIVQIKGGGVTLTAAMSELAALAVKETEAKGIPWGTRMICKFAITMNLAEDFRPLCNFFPAADKPLAFTWCQLPSLQDEDRRGWPNG